MQCKTLNKLNYGCGLDYRPGWINADINRAVKADVYLSPDDTALPFAENAFDEVLLDNVIEHIPKNRLFDFLDQIYRVTRPGGLVRIYVPHYTSVYAYANLSHQSAFAIGAFDCCAAGGMFNSNERYGQAAFRIKRQRLLFFGHNPARCRWLGKLPVNWLFNGHWLWQKIMERFQFAGFDELYVELEAVKKAAPAAAPVNS